MLLAAIFLNRNSIPVGGENWGETSFPFAAIMRQHLWLLWYVLIALIVGLLFSALKFPTNAHGAVVGLSAAATAFLAVVWWKGNHPPGYLKVAA